MAAPSESVPTKFAVLDSALTEPSLCFLLDLLSPLGIVEVRQ